MNKPTDLVTSDSAADSKRSNNRNSLFLKAILRLTSTGAEREVRVRNLSSGGMMAEAPLQANRGEPVEINLKNIGWVTGKIVWLAESRCGIAFDYPIDPIAARQPVGTAAADANIPSYLRKLNQTAGIAKPPIRRV